MTDQPQVNPKDALLKIMQGETGAMPLPKVAIVTGKKLRNDLLREFAKRFRESGIDNKDVVDVLLMIDEAIEKGLLTDEVLHFVHANPGALDTVFNTNQTK